MNHKTVGSFISLSVSACCNAAVMVRFNMPSYTVSEAAMMVRVAVQISSASELVRVNISTIDETALGKSLLS